MVTAMIKRELMFSAMFLILSYYMIENDHFLKNGTNSDLILFSLLIMGSFFLIISSINGLIGFRKKRVRDNAFQIVHLFSSLLFFILSIFSIAFKM